MPCCHLRPSNVDTSEGTLDELARIVTQIREAWPHVRILLRGDSGFCREAITAQCETSGVDYVFGVAATRGLSGGSRARCGAHGAAA
ncbi:MAG: hypothetical protein F4186_05215 [Boseongicola sp. SB0676_bin_33]|uniref:Transposase DDE domain-containing protein n=1 Tax=Boseongicola sp. SB0664_bin_43 TaxID=2604844 RepID=A0A6B0Y2Q2_9RHOB|nr:hypothetical protein [Boseongicola sp. SB0664_bin_43]MYF88797.1 hypothetical protein [Boseongicola sp. SB0676_bin_33]